ncbi:MAG TPA: sulfite exporter TauE/SafE family protein [Ramlibacter sp.]|nr:sulfite exporter TauE/SafE family protein [Ramlibacter sp.]
MQLPPDFPWFAFILAFVLGGSVKGALGVGLPLVAVPVLSLWIPSPQAIGMMLVPVLSSNLWQAVDGGRLLQSLKRFRGFMIAQIIATVLTVRMTLALSTSQLNVLLACVLLLGVAIMAFQPTLRVSPRHEEIFGTGVGLFSGLLGGVSALTGPIVITYLMSLKLERDVFVASISVIYLSSSLPLYGSMLWFHRIAFTDVALSALAMLPMAAGLFLGKLLRQRLAEAAFRKLLLVFLALLAILLLLK